MGLGVENFSIQIKRGHPQITVREHRQVYRIVQNLFEAYSRETY